MLKDIIRKLDKTDNDLYVTVILGFFANTRKHKGRFFRTGRSTNG